MSRIGKKAIAVPEKVQVLITETDIEVKGPKGSLKHEYNSLVSIKKDGNTLTVSPVDDSTAAKSMWGTTRTMVSNMVNGVVQGFTKSLEFNGVGYKAAVNGKVLVLNLGHSHPIEYSLPAGIEAKVNKNQIDIMGFDKELVGFVAANVRSFRPTEPYKGKGLKYINEVVVRKAGKAGAKK